MWFNLRYCFTVAIAGVLFIEPLDAADAICERIDFNDFTSLKIHQCSDGFKEILRLSAYTASSKFTSYRPNVVYFLSNVVPGISCCETIESFFVDEYTEIRMMYQLTFRSTSSLVVSLLDLDQTDTQGRPVSVQVWSTNAATRTWSLFLGRVEKQIRRAVIQVEVNMSTDGDVAIEYITIFNPLVQEKFCMELDEFYVPPPTSAGTTSTATRPPTTTTLRTTTSRIVPTTSTIRTTSRIPSTSTTVSSTTSLPPTTRPMTTTIRPTTSTTVLSTTISTTTVRPTTRTRTTTTSTITSTPTTSTVTRRTTTPTVPSSSTTSTATQSLSTSTTTMQSTSTSTSTTVLTSESSSTTQNSTNQTLPTSMIFSTTTMPSSSTPVEPSTSSTASSLASSTRTPAITTADPEPMTTITSSYQTEIPSTPRTTTRRTTPTTVYTTTQTTPRTTTSRELVSTTTSSTRRTRTPTITTTVATTTPPSSSSAPATTSSATTEAHSTRTTESTTPLYPSTASSTTSLPPTSSPAPEPTTSTPTLRPSFVPYRDQPYNETKAIWTSFTGIFLLTLVLSAAMGAYWYVGRQHSNQLLSRELELHELQNRSTSPPKIINRHVNPLAQRNQLLREHRGFHHRNFPQHVQRVDSLRSTYSDNSSNFTNLKRNIDPAKLGSVAVSRPFSLQEEIKKARLKTRFNKF